MSPFTSSNDTDDSRSALTQGAHTVLLNGVQLHYQVEGNGPLLFAASPGWGVGSAYLQRGLGFLLGQFKVVFVDTCGSGLSGHPADDTKMGSNEMADDLDALRAHLGLSTFTLLGYSNGGAIALSFAERYPGRVSKLLLIDSQVFGFSAGEDTQAFFTNRVTDHRYAAPPTTAGGPFADFSLGFAGTAEECR